MQRNPDFWLWKTLEQAILKHSLGTGEGLFGRLANQHERAVPGILRVGQDGSGPDERGHVQVMSACVHDWDFVPGILFDADLARVGKPRLLFHGQRIQLGP